MDDPNLLQMTLPGGMEVGGEGVGGGSVYTYTTIHSRLHAAWAHPVTHPPTLLRHTFPPHTLFSPPLPPRRPARVLQVSTLVTRRSEELQTEGARLNTSEYFRQLINTPERAQPKVGQGGGARQCRVNSRVGCAWACKRGRGRGGLCLL